MACMDRACARMAQGGRMNRGMSDTAGEMQAESNVGFDRRSSTWVRVTIT